MIDPEEKNALLKIYKMMKEKGILTKHNQEYELIISNEEQKEKHNKEFKDWHDSLPNQEQQDFDFVFGKN